MFYTSVDLWIDGVPHLRQTADVSTWRCNIAKCFHIFNDDDIVCYSLKPKKKSNSFNFPTSFDFLIINLNHYQLQLTSLSEELLFFILFISLFFVHGGESELLLGVGVTVGLEGCKFMTFSLDCLFGEILAGKLKVFVQWVRLRTIFIHTKHNTEKDSRPTCFICQVSRLSANGTNTNCLHPHPVIRSAFCWPFSHHRRDPETAVVDTWGWGLLQRSCSFLRIPVYSCWAIVCIFDTLLLLVCFI